MERFQGHKDKYGKGIVSWYAIFFKCQAEHKIKQSQKMMEMLD
jgi:hypothetical protein